MTTTTIAVADLLRLRQALRGLLDTHRGSSTKALQAAQAARQAYLLTFTEAEKAQVLALAQQKKRAAPAGHFLCDEPALDTFEQAVSLLGTQLIDQALPDPLL